jgi:PAS domain S-box-containing protein
MQGENDLEPTRGEAQARLAAIVESSDDAIVSKTLQGVIQTWNKGAERIFGWTADEVIGKPITIIIPPDRLQEEPVILSRIQAGDRVDHFQTIRVTKDGRMINVSVTISPVRDETGRIIGASKIARDITEQKRLQRELEEAKESAEAANRAKDHFLSVLSHELRTPLTPVLAAVSLIEQDSNVPREFAEQLRMIRRNVETEARLVDDLLDLTRIARGKVQLRPEVLDAHAIVRHVIGMFDAEVEAKGLTVALALRARQSQVWADPGRFQQVLLNLVSNAVKFTPQDGTITIRTSNENGTIKIEITDTGVGIEADMLPRLFRPFEQGERTVTRQFGGLGLGLSIVKSLVEMHKASISAVSEGKDQGATFTLRMETVSPAQAQLVQGPGAAPGTGAGAGAGAGGAAGRVYRVLLVEDHNDTRGVLTKLLTSFGCDVTAVGTVREAVAAAERQQFDLLLSDIGLPDGTGLEVMRHVAARSKVTGIALSGFGQDDDIRRSREAGFVTHLTKPVSFQALKEVIRNVTPTG